MHDDIEIDRSSLGEPGLLQQFQIGQSLLNAMQRLRVYLPPMM
jgi:hypothetical protein